VDADAASPLAAASAAGAAGAAAPAAAPSAAGDPALADCIRTLAAAGRPAASGLARRAAAAARDPTVRDSSAPPPLPEKRNVVDRGETVEQHTDGTTDGAAVGRTDGNANAADDRRTADAAEAARRCAMARPTRWHT